MWKDIGLSAASLSNAVERARAGQTIDPRAPPDTRACNPSPHGNLRRIVGLQASGTFWQPFLLVVISPIFLPEQVACIFGGTQLTGNILTQNQTPAIVVGTPGRILDLTVKGDLNLSEVNCLIVDDAETLLNLGFENEIREIAKTVPARSRQTILLSSEWSTVVQKLASDIMSNPFKVIVRAEKLIDRGAVKEVIEVVDRENRIDKLLSLLKEHRTAHPSSRVIVFSLYLKEAMRLEEMLTREGFRCRAIHGNTSGAEVAHAEAYFRNGELPVLIVTDVALRMLSPLAHADLVVSFEFPLTFEDYAVRITRAGGAGKEVRVRSSSAAAISDVNPAQGVAHTFFTKESKSHAPRLIRELKQAGQNIPDQLLQLASTRLLLD